MRSALEALVQAVGEDEKRPNGGSRMRCGGKAAPKERVFWVHDLGGGRCFRTVLTGR